MKRFVKFLSLVIAGLLACLATASAGQDTLTQVSTIDALLNGVYDGQITLKQLLTHGDFGIGTFHALNGEMVVMEGKVYQVLSNGQVRQPDADQTTPFAAITFFSPDLDYTLPAGTTYEAFEAAVDSRLPSPNLFYAVKLSGRFDYVKTRSVPAQCKPYPALKEVARQQPEFEFRNISGTMVGFRCPAYVKGINVPGYHLHFLSKDGNAGGHVLAFKSHAVQVQLDTTTEFLMQLPTGEAFGAVDLTKDKSADLMAVEK